MKIQIIHTALHIYRGRVEQWVPWVPNTSAGGAWEFVRRATARDRKTIITVR